MPGTYLSRPSMRATLFLRATRAFSRTLRRSESYWAWSCRGLRTLLRAKDGEIADARKPEEGLARGATEARPAGGYPSKEERDKRLQARADDPEFTEVVRKAESNPATKLIAKVHNIDMVPHGPFTAITLTK